MDENQPGSGPEGQWHVDEFLLDGVHNASRVDLQDDNTVAPLPAPDALPWVPVGHAGLAEHGVLEHDLLAGSERDVDTGLEQTLMDGTPRRQQLAAS